MMMLVVPRLRDRGSAELESHAKKLSLAFRLLRSEAVLNGTAYRMNYDLDQQLYWVSPHDASTDLVEFAVDIGNLSKGHRIEEPAGIVDVMLPTLGANVTEGQIYTVFYPDGTIDPTIIHLTNGTEDYTLHNSASARS